MIEKNDLFNQSFLNFSLSLLCILNYQWIKEMLEAINLFKVLGVEFLPCLSG